MSKIRHEAAKKYLAVMNILAIFVKKLNYMKQYIRTFFVAAASVIAFCGGHDAVAAERIETVDSVQAKVTVTESGVELSACGDSAMRFEIYSITGKLVKTVDVSNEPVEVLLPNGCYIVRTSLWSKKVVVK